MSNSLQPHGLQHTRPPCPSPSSGACSSSCPLSRWCHPTISSSVIPFSSCLQSFLHQGLFKWVSSLHQVAKVLEAKAYSLGNFKICSKILLVVVITLYITPPSLFSMVIWHHPYGTRWRGTKEPLDEGERGEWKSWLKAQHSENEDHGIWSHHFMGNRWGNNGNSDWLFLWAPKSLQMVIAAMKLKDAYSLEEKLWPT